MRANRAILCILMEYLCELGKANLISCLAIITNTNQPVVGYNVVLVLGSLVHYCFKNNKWWNCNPLGINNFNNCDPFSIAWLYCPRPASPIGSSNNFCSCNNTYLEASFIKILDILIKNPILYNCVLDAFKPALNKYRVFTFSLLIVVFTIVFGF